MRMRLKTEHGEKKTRWIKPKHCVKTSCLNIGALQVAVVEPVWAALWGFHAWTLRFYCLLFLGVQPSAWESGLINFCVAHFVPFFRNCPEVFFHLLFLGATDGSLAPSPCCWSFYAELKTSMMVQANVQVIQNAQLITSNILIVLDHLHRSSDN